MNKKRKIQFILLLTFIICITTSSFSYVNAKELDGSKQFLNYFDLDKKVLYEKELNYGSLNYYNKDFKLTQGFDRFYSATFSKSKYIIGEGSTGAEVGIMVFTKTKYGISLKGEPIVDTIGASGIYSKRIKFNESDEYHIVIAVKYNKKVTYKHYVVNKKDENTINKLETFDYNFFDNKADDDDGFSIFDMFK